MNTDLTGQRFGRLTVLRGTGRSRKSQGRTWLCVCDCGAETEVATGTLRRGHTRSCGCLLREYAFKHGLFHTRAHSAWRNMIARCYIPSETSYPRYGARGIKVCDRWRNDPVRFIADMGQPPSPKHTLDRIDSTKGYSPENCRWATPKEQARNRKTNRLLTIGAETLSLVQWAERYGVSAVMVRLRLERGWETLRALTEPAHPRRYKNAARGAA